jgi:hypothetical protein
MEPSGSSQQARVPRSNLPCESARDVAGRRQPPSCRKCSKQELLNLLAIMKDVMPIGGEEWDEVLDHHSLLFPGYEVDSTRTRPRHPAASRCHGLPFLFPAVVAGARLRNPERTSRKQESQTGLKI